MKIIHLNADKGIHPSRSKGAAVHLRAMREAFDELGHQVLAIDQPDPVLLHEALAATGASGPVELVYERLSLNAYAGSEFCKALGVPHALEVNSPLDEEQSRHRGSSQLHPDQSKLSSLLSSADLLLCVSEECASWARAKGAQDERIVVAGNGVDAERFHPRRRAAGLLSEHVNDSDFVIGFHGRLRPWHGFERLVKALADLLERGLDLQLVMLGHGEFEQAIGNRLPQKNWTHLPWVDHEQVGGYVARFDVLPLSYDPDQPCYFSPLKLLEGMAAGAVAVVPDLGGLAQTVQHNHSGLVYDACDPGGLTEAIASLYQDLPLRERLAKEGRRVAESQSWLSIANRVIARFGGQQD